MNESESQSEKSTINEIDAVLKQLATNWAKIKKARKDLDFKTSAQSLEALNKDIRQLGESWSEHQTVIKDAIQVDQNFVQSDAYPTEVENALKNAGITLKGEFPSYEFPPFKLTFSRENGLVKLSMGRRSQQLKSFAPAQLSVQIFQEYQKIINNKFNAEILCKDLLGAYEMANKLNLNKDSVVWGHPVPLKEIYKLLTLKQSAKQDYPEIMFSYDLARLKEQFDIGYDGHRFEFVPSRNQSSGFLLVNSKGQESRVSSLIIYDKDN